jgi:hypothetical protein
LVENKKERGDYMFEKVKLIAEIRQLKAKINTLEIENELLSDKRLDELIKSLDKQNHYEELEEENKKLKIKNQQLR